MLNFAIVKGLRIKKQRSSIKDFDDNPVYCHVFILIYQLKALNLLTYL